MATASASSGRSTGLASSPSCSRCGRSSCWRPPRGSATSLWDRWNGQCAGSCTDGDRVSSAPRPPSLRRDARMALILGLDHPRGRESAAVVSGRRALQHLELDHGGKGQNVPGDAAGAGRVVGVGNRCFARGPELREECGESRWRNPAVHLAYKLKVGARLEILAVGGAVSSKAPGSKDQIVRGPAIEEYGFAYTRLLHSDGGLSLVRAALRYIDHDRGGERRTGSLPSQSQTEPPNVRGAKQRDDQHERQDTCVSFHHSPPPVNAPLIRPAGRSGT